MKNEKVAAHAYKELVEVKTQLAASHELILRLTEKLEKATSALLAGKVREDDLRASVERNQTWLTQKSNEKVEALRDLSVARESLYEVAHQRNEALSRLAEVERAARSLLSRKDFWVAAATLMALPGELDNLADVLLPKEKP